MKRKQICSSIFLLIYVTNILAQPKPKDPNASLPFRPNPQTNEKALKHFTDEKFRVIVHWGPYALNGWEASWSMHNREEYESYYGKWTPKDFNADAWGKLFQTLGAKYLVWVTKHHDGFCLWDTKTTDNNIMNFPYRENITVDFAKICKKYGMDFGAYLSIIDVNDSKWNRVYAHGDKMPGFPEQISQIAKLIKDQTLELINEFHPSVLWFDGAWLDGWRSSNYPVNLENTFRKASPDILITRLGNNTDDFESMEAKIGTYRQYPWETVTSVAYPKYSWTPNLKYKSVPYLVETLSRVVCGNGNYLLAFIPNTDGGIPEEQQKIATEMGAWVHKNAQAIFGTSGGPYYPNSWGAVHAKTQKFIFNILSESPDTLSLPSIGAKVLKTKIINGGKISIKSSNKDLTIYAPVNERGSEGVSIVELTLDHEISGMIEAFRPNTKIKESINGDVRPIEDRKGKVL